eukprot:scaffold368_cov258-Pinguiococcus_pyrenoidosus.AAC.29
MGVTDDFRRLASLRTLPEISTCSGSARTAPAKARSMRSEVALSKGGRTSFRTNSMISLSSAFSRPLSERRSSSEMERDLLLITSRGPEASVPSASSSTVAGPLLSETKPSKKFSRCWWMARKDVSTFPVKSSTTCRTGTACSRLGFASTRSSTSSMWTAGSSRPAPASCPSSVPRPKIPPVVSV